jgi:two-component system chemotaxis response regulator CheB
MTASINPEKIARDVIVVGASAGGIRAVIELLSRLPADLPAFIGVVIHRGAESASNWSAVLGVKTKLRVVEPDQGDSLTHGVVYIAPSDSEDIDRGPCPVGDLLEPRKPPRITHPRRLQ